MRSSRLTFLLCVLASAAIHAALFRQAERWTFGGGWPSRPRPAKPYTVAPPGTEADPPPRTPIGEADGVGVSFNSSPGDVPQTGLRAVQDQADFTRKPAGLLADAPPSPKPMPQAVVAAAPAAMPTPPVSTLRAFRKPTPPQPPSPPAEADRPTPAPPSASAAGGVPRPQSDQDAQIFAKRIDVQYRRGRVIAAPGRKVKFTDPILNLSAWLAAGLNNGTRLDLRIKVNPDGSAEDVRVVKSSGNASVDRAFVLAAFKSWYEPAKDAGGRTIADEIDFPVSFQSQR